MSYDPYSDPCNPVTKSKKPDMGSDPGYHTVEPGNYATDGAYSPFEYGSGGRDIENTMDMPGVHEGTTEVADAVLAWDPWGEPDSDGDDPSDYHPKGDM